MRVNLIAKKKQNLTINWIEVLIILIIFLLIFILGLNYYLNYIKLTILRDVVDNLDNQLAIYLPKQEEYLQLQKEVENLETDFQAGQQVYAWVEALNELGYVVPETVTLKYVIINKGSLSLAGIAKDSKDIIEMVDNFKISPYFNTIKLKQVNQQQEILFQLEALLSKKGG